MEASLSAILNTYTSTFKETLMDVLVVVVPAAIGLLVIKLSVAWARQYFLKIAPPTKLDVEMLRGTSVFEQAKKDFRDTHDGRDFDDY